MWPIVMGVLRRYALQLTLPIAVVIGTNWLCHCIEIILTCTQKKYWRTYQLLHLISIQVSRATTSRACCLINTLPTAVS